MISEQLKKEAIKIALDVEKGKLHAIRYLRDNGITAHSYSITTLAYMLQGWLNEAQQIASNERIKAMEDMRQQNEELLKTLTGIISWGANKDGKFIYKASSEWRDETISRFNLTIPK